MLEVIDRGRGLVPGAVPGFRVRESIQARMAEVGGSATWRAGGGTNVRLTWPAESRTGRSPVLLQRRRTYPLVVVAGIVTNTYLAWRHPGDHPLLGAATAALARCLLLGSALLD